MTDFYARPSRYVPGKVLIVCLSPDGYTTRAGYAVIGEPYRAKWSRKEQGFLLSRAMAARFIRDYNLIVDGPVKSE